MKEKLEQYGNGENSNPSR